MALTKGRKASIVAKYGKSPDDSGSSRVQIALLTERIKDLTEHCKRFPKDSGAKRSLLKVVGARRRLTKYYQRKDLEGYRALIKELGLRK